ncbi:MAG: O-antigen ligase family protein [Pseudobdellovibrio sp.]
MLNTEKINSFTKPLGVRAVKIFQFTLFFFALSLFVSKSGLMIFFVLGFLLSLPYINFSVFLKDKFVRFYFFTFSVFFISNALSLGGFDSVKKAFISWPYFLIVFPLMVAVREEKNLKKYVVSGLFLGLFAAAVKSFLFLYDKGQLLNFNFEYMRAESFWDIGRWSTFTSLFCIGVLPFIIYVRMKTSLKIISISLLIVSFVCLILANSRAPLLLTTGVLILEISFLIKNKVYLLGVSLLLVLGLAFTPMLQKRIVSSFDLSFQNGEIVSKHASNTGRLAMWKVAWDYWNSHKLTPTGFDNYEGPLKSFLADQTEEYRAKYTDVQFSYHDTHNSYLFLWIQSGFVFTVLFIALIFKMLLNSLKFTCLSFCKKTKCDALSIAVCLSIVFHILLGFVYTSMVSYESITLFIALWLSYFMKDSALKGVDYVSAQN